MLAELSFGDEAWLRVIDALATAVFVTALAGIGIAIFNWKLAGRREQRELRADLLKRTSENHAGFYFLMQEFRRTDDADDLDDEAKHEARQALRDAYVAWASTREGLEAELSSLFGPLSEPTLTWHAMGDLLTVRYFGLLDPAPGPGHLPQEGIRKANQIGGKDGDETDARGGPVRHSGLTADDMRLPKTVLAEYRRNIGAFATALFEADFVTKLR